MTTAERKRRAAQIRALNARLGRADIPALAQLAIEEGLYSEAEREALFFRAVCEDCRRALSAIDRETHLPFAQPIPEDGMLDDGDADDEMPTADSPRRAPQWAQLALFTEEEFERMLSARAQGIRDDLTKFTALVTYFRERFGRVPKCATQLDFGL